MPWHRPYRRLATAFLIWWVFTVVGFGIGLHIVNDKADKGELTAERTDRLVADCHSRVEGRDVLRDIIIGAYAPPAGTPPERVALYDAKRDEELSRAPQLRCVMKAGIPLPVPVTRKQG